jgi:3',5'-cyclic-AMP phosphodiesterase
LVARPVLIAQLSDLHVTPPGTLAYGCVDTAAALTRAIETLNTFAPLRPDLVVISGDIAHSALPEEYEHAKKLLGALQMPFVAIPGNHDSRALMHAAFPDPAFGAPESALNSTRRVRELDILLVDSTVPNAVHGELDAATLTWLEANLARWPTRPALMFLHHPPFDTGIVSSDGMRLLDADPLAKLIKRHPRVLLVAAGHVHRAAQTVFAGAAATICPAGEQAVTLEFDMRWPEVFRIEPPAFHLHAWLPGENFGSVVTHVVPIGAFPGPYPYGHPTTAALP